VALLPALLPALLGGGVPVFVFPTGPGEIEDPGVACDLALARLLGQFSDSTALRELICSLVSPLDELEAALLDVHYNRWIAATTTGEQLDVLGRIVREQRNGLDDATYLRAIRTRVLINRSSGKREELIDIATTFEPGLTAVEMREHAPNSITTRAHGPFDADPKALAERLNSARAGGVNLQVIYTPGADATQAFTLADATVTTDPARGWGSTTETTGGELSGVVG